MQEKQFDQFAIDTRILRAVADEGYVEPTPIQCKAIPPLLDGRDLLGTARTGTGKTAAFALPILDRLARDARRTKPAIEALVLVPTRELAVQVEASIARYGRHLSVRSAVLVGGLPIGPQVKALAAGPRVVVATPGRLLDLMGQGHVRLDRVRELVLDEADRMLDMGFLPDIRRIVSRVPTDRQTMLFSATMPDPILSLAADMLRDPVRVAVSPPASVPVDIDQRVMFVDSAGKRELLIDLLRSDQAKRVLVFTRTKHRANRLARYLEGRRVSADAIHSNKSQNARQRALDAFAGGRVRVLIATDIVARGIDVDGISHVVNYELPEDPASYVHRIGRTARAGALGVAVSFCEIREVPLLHEIEKLTGSPLTRIEDHAFHSRAVATLDNGRTETGNRSRGSAGRSGWRSFRPRRTGMSGAR